MGRPPKGVTVEDRFWENVQKTGGCWHWLASLTASGYGLLRVGSRISVYAHRLSLALSGVVVPADMLIRLTPIAPVASVFIC